MFNSSVKEELKNGLWIHVRCPQCSGELVLSNGAARCCLCHKSYSFSKNQQGDFRLKGEKHVSLSLTLGQDKFPSADQIFYSKGQDKPEHDIKELGPIPHHLLKEMMDYFPRAGDSRSWALDLGCGDQVHKSICQKAGFQYIGVDFQSPNADYLADAHALPFEDKVFEFVLCIAVLEHLQHPLVAMREIYRVLKPGGRLIGTVSFLESFHDNSFYHHTYLGVWNDVSASGFDIVKIAPNPRWPGLIALSKMGLFPRLPQVFIHILVWPLLFLHRTWWKLGGLLTGGRKMSEVKREFYTAGSFYFVADKNKVI